METIDIIILCCFLPAVYSGLKNGLVRQIISLLVIFLGISLSIRFSDKISQWLLTFMNVSATWLKAISFAVILIIVAILLHLAGKLIEKIIKVTLLGWVNRLLGLVFSLAWCFLIISTLAYFLNSINASFEVISADKLKSSKFFMPLVDAANAIFPYLKSLF